MNQQEAETILSKVDWFSYNEIDGLRLDGYYVTKELDAFVWALNNNPKMLERLSSKYESA